MISFGAGFHSVGLYRTQDRNLLIDTQDFSHLRFKCQVAPLQVVAHFMWLYLLLGEDLADRALRDPCQADVPRTRRMLAGMASQQSRRPEFMRVSHVLGLSAGQRHQPRPCFQRDLRLLAGPRAIVERCHHPEPACPRQAALDGLVRHPNRDPNPVARRIVPIAQQDPGALHPACRLRPRTRDRLKLCQLPLPNG